MGNHRADRRGPRRPSGTPDTYVGRRIATRMDTSAPGVAAPRELLDASPAELPLVAREVIAAAPDAKAGQRAALRQATHHFNDHEATAQLPLVLAPAPPQAPGKRKAVKHAGSRGSLIKGLPSAPILLGVVTLAISVGGAVSSAGPDLAATDHAKFNQASALSGASGTGSVNDLERGPSLSRDSQRTALGEAADSELVAAAEQQAQQRNAALAQFAKEAEAQADVLALNQWVVPLNPVVLTARFGEYGLWSSYHTGLDFNGNTGDPIMAIANGIVTFTGYDGSYGNKTVVTLEDGTELWFCHQTTILVNEGDVVSGGQVIGTVGTTGNVTGSHLHVEVRPGGGDPVDPYEAFVVHGVDMP